MAFAHPSTDTLPRHSLIIGGVREEGGGGAATQHIYPATGRVTREIVMASPADVDRAVAAARAAFPAWRAMPGDRRRDLFFRLAAAFETKSAEFAPSLVAENGSIAMVAPYMGHDAAQKFRYFGGWCDKLHGRTVPMWGAPAHDYVSYEPYGVVGVIIPWNGPLFAASMVLAPALAAGNCVVLKAPDLAPYSTMQLVELLHEAGIPPGVVNLVTGGADVGGAMVAHPGIDKIEFIGSGATATKVLTSAQTLKPVGLELGGKSAVIVFEDADLTLAAKKGLTGAVSSSGPGCVNGTRLLVKSGLYEQYLAMLGAIAGHIKVGDPFRSVHHTGAGHFRARDRSHPRNGDARSARRRAGRQRRRTARRRSCGWIFPPRHHPRRCRQRQRIGAQRGVRAGAGGDPFDTEEEAIALANASEFGLGAYLHTQNLRRAHHVAGQLEACMIDVNGSGEAMQPNCPLGGWKRSGHGGWAGSRACSSFSSPRTSG
jgi:acyl-CoA reductase-like NAD-dependent aldehyde dehydrogenase